MSIIIKDDKVINASGSIEQIITDFNEYLKIIRETTIPIPKDQFNNLSENHNKLYGDYMEVIKANKDLQEEIKNLKHAHTLNILENNKEASTIIAKRAAEIDKLNSKLNELQKAYDEQLSKNGIMIATEGCSSEPAEKKCKCKDTIAELRAENEKLKNKVALYKCIEEVGGCIEEEIIAEMGHQYDDDLYRLFSALSSIDDEEAKAPSPKPNEECNSTVTYKKNDIAFIIERSCEDPTDDSTTVVHVTLAMYTGILWHSLDMRVLETDFADIVPIHNAEYLKEYFGREDIASAVKFHY